MSSKLAKEQFVSGHSGTSLGEIYLLTTTLVAGYLLRCILIVSLPSGLKKSTIVSFLLDYFTIVLPGVLVFTVLADYTLYVLGFIITASVLIASVHLYSSNTSIASRFKNLSKLTYPTRLPCVTLTRTFVTLITAIAILAVDFQIYPRRLAKAETYGTGLMDVGVGAFIMSHGITAPVARGRRGGHMIASTLRGLLPLIVIGVLRLLAVKGTDYQEHVTEYGVHWNFFFTIAAVIVSRIINVLETVFMIVYRKTSLFNQHCKIITHV